MAWTPPPKRDRLLSIAIPASTVSDIPHLREKTLKVGLIGRALAIFRVDEVIIYPDKKGRDQSKDAAFIALVLRYMETPQYLRKSLFRIRPELRYVGVLPPLRTPHHPLRKKVEDLEVGEVREGVTVEVSKDGTYVDVGVGVPVLVPKEKIPLKRRITVRILEVGENLIARREKRSRIQVYWGYNVKTSKLPLSQVAKKGRYDLILATSRLGDPVTSVMEKLRRLWETSKKILVAFGAPDRGLREILADEGVKIEEFAHLIVNTVPRQGTETVRTEEALYATLSILNLLDG